MISPTLFKQEAALSSKRKDSMVVSVSTLFVRGMQSVLEDIAKRFTFKVKVEEDASEALLRKINGQLYSVITYLKTAPTASPGTQKISLKIPDIVTLNRSIEDILKRIESKELKVTIPSISQVRGEVKVLNHPKEYNFDRLHGALIDIRDQLSKIKLEVPPQKDIKFPEIKFPDIKIPEYPKQIGLVESKQILQALTNLQKEIQSLPKNIPQTQFPSAISIDNFPPQKYPMPVTNININPLRGSALSTAVTVTSSATALPTTILDYRRSVMIFNNSASTTVYLGGSTVTSTNGFPILAQTYSPSIDAGPKMTVYGITDSGSANVRVFEVSNEDIGG